MRLGIGASVRACCSCTVAANLCRMMFVSSLRTDDATLSLTETRVRIEETNKSKWSNVLVSFRGSHYVCYKRQHQRSTDHDNAARWRTEVVVVVPVVTVETVVTYRRHYH